MTGSTGLISPHPEVAGPTRKDSGMGDGPEISHLYYVFSINYVYSVDLVLENNIITHNLIFEIYL